MFRNALVQRQCAIASSRSSWHFGDRSWFRSSSSRKTIIGNNSQRGRLAVVETHHHHRRYRHNQYYQHHHHHVAVDGEVTAVIRSSTTAGWIRMGRRFSRRFLSSSIRNGNHRRSKPNHRDFLLDKNNNIYNNKNNKSPHHHRLKKQRSSVLHTGGFVITIVAVLCGGVSAVIMARCEANPSHTTVERPQTYGSNRGLEGE